MAIKNLHNQNVFLSHHDYKQNVKNNQNERIKQNIIVKTFTLFYCGEFIDNNDKRNKSINTQNKKIPSKLSPVFLMKHPLSSRFPPEGILSSDG